ncbi:hypothetical protein B0H34DRAFT_63920 [Crassisporium funariophilum]|nr:hypothetical protein B0H34DRAFT_63920 [Crassisporium funariophilum]
MAIFRGLDTPLESEASSVQEGGESSLQHALIALTQMANPDKRGIEAKLGLQESARIILDIIMLAQRAKIHRADCLFVADQAYHLLNTVDASIQGRAIDVNNILRDHIKRLNRDLAVIRSIMKSFASWWILTRFWTGSRQLDKCHDILKHGMDLYLLLLRCSLSQADRRNSMRRRHTIAQNLGRRPSLDYSIRDFRDQTQPSAKASTKVRSAWRPSSRKRPQPAYPGYRQAF